MVKKGKKPASAVRVRQGTKKQQKARTKKEAAKLSVPGGFFLVKETFRLAKDNWQVLGGILIVYAIINIIFTGGLSAVINTFAIVKDNLLEDKSFSSGLSGFSSLLGNSQSGSELQSVLLILESLVIIWVLRQLLAKKKISVKEAYYGSMYPLIPFLLVVLVIFIQLLPITLGSGAVALVSETLASNAAATLLVALVLVPLAAWSVYMISSSIFALYIVTLPDMRPRQALRSAKRLVKFRRLKVIRRLLFLPVFIFLALAAIMMPLILFVHVLVVPVFYVFSVLLILFAHTYLYNLYRGLLNG